MNENYNELYEKFHKLKWLLKRYRMKQYSEGAPFADATRGQGRVLAMLKIQPEMSARDLSYLLGIRITSLNELLAKLEKGGYIGRKPSDADKRVSIVYLTEAGKATKQAAPDYGEVFACLSDEEQASFGGYLDRIIDALEPQVGGEISDEELERWKRDARARMGEERFEHLMAMPGGWHGGPHGPFGPHGSCGGHRHHGPHHGPHHMPGEGRCREGVDKPKED